MTSYRKTKPGMRRIINGNGTYYTVSTVTTRVKFLRQKSQLRHWSAWTNLIQAIGFNMQLYCTGWDVWPVLVLIEHKSKTTHHNQPRTHKYFSTWQIHTLIDNGRKSIQRRSNLKMLRAEEGESRWKTVWLQGSALTCNYTVAEFELTWRFFILSI